MRMCKETTKIVCKTLSKDKSRQHQNSTPSLPNFAWDAHRDGKIGFDLHCTLPINCFNFVRSNIQLSFLRKTLYRLCVLRQVAVGKNNSIIFFKVFKKLLHRSFADQKTFANIRKDYVIRVS